MDEYMSLKLKEMQMHVNEICKRFRPKENLLEVNRSRPKVAENNSSLVRLLTKEATKNEELEIIRLLMKLSNMSNVDAAAAVVLEPIGAFAI